MLYIIFEAFCPVPNFKGTLYSKNSLGKNHNGKAFGSQLLHKRGVNSDDRSKKVFSFFIMNRGPGMVVLKVTFLITKLMTGL